VIRKPVNAIERAWKGNRIAPQADYARGVGLGRNSVFAGEWAFLNVLYGQDAR
jgi:hypothetical protein